MWSMALSALGPNASLSQVMSSIIYSIIHSLPPNRHLLAVKIGQKEHSPHYAVFTAIRLPLIVTSVLPLKTETQTYERPFCSLTWHLHLTDHQSSWWDADLCQIPSIFQDTVQTSFPGALSEGFIMPLHDKGCYYLPSWNFCKIP